MTGAIVAALTSEGYRVRQVLPGHTVHQLQADRYEADLSSPQALHELHRLLGGPDGGAVGTAINFLGLSQAFGPPNSEGGEVSVKTTEWTFHLVKEFAEDLRASAVESGRFINLTALDGQFGLKSGAVSWVSAGTLGISKTLQREYPRLHVKNIDVEAEIPPDLLAAQLLQELASEDDLLEVGLTREGRWRLVLKQESAPRNLPPLALDAESVVLITGGAYGVTAEVAKGLAATAKPRLILVGRSALPEPETPRTRDLDRVSLRKLLLDDARRTQTPVVPAEIEQRINRILKDREIRNNIEACTAAGAMVEYHSLDVRDAQQFGGFIDDLYERFGRIDGVVHGAGVIEDKRIADKTTTSFANVFHTKVDSALTLARRLRPDKLRFLVFFGSVSGRFGNAGQVDYSAANEVLNKLADHLASCWDARVVCINWGPWDAGMVSDELRRLYASRGIELIAVPDGVRACLDELRMPSRNAEVVISRSVEQLIRVGRQSKSEVPSAW
ncbi:MAG TPA: SDR family NAD(P)-dependent oxidoreductase [Gemmataceae bacterium]|nr:SDR family NAD(P)-dependent oxidoreductase [Gemmataceae bacterium]